MDRVGHEMPVSEGEFHANEIHAACSHLIGELFEEFPAPLEPRSITDNGNDKHLFELGLKHCE